MANVYYQQHANPSLIQSKRVGKRLREMMSFLQKKQPAPVAATMGAREER